MITDNETNSVYFSRKLEEQFPETATRIFNTLKLHDVEPQLLDCTKDIWARDYMPVQVSPDKFIEYRYDPDYLQGEYKGARDLKTYPDMVCDKLGLKTEKSDLILDGGNIAKSSNCIILTDKAVRENRLFYSKAELISKLQKTFEVDKVILIPWDSKFEPRYGHSDGMVRFIDDETVLLNWHYKTEKVLLNRLKSSGLKCEFLNYKVQKQHKNNWAYINFLQTKDLILIPKLNAEEDEQAFNQIATFYPDYTKNNRIVQIEMNDIIAKGGALNCITWTRKI
ncbi:MAG: agmatine deiminase family protein [Paludibacter sp.]